ncbi:hypothetical protein HY503_00195 [Candidatus Woesebacteria bacterium]|nr:hypothetical protein [Candidatus Woesebacteria bacterium]
MKKLAIIVVFLLLIIGVGEASAKRILPRAKPASGTKVATPTRGVATGVKFRGDRRAIIVTFSNLSIATKVDYVLSYNTRGTTQGASGSLTSSAGSSVTRELLFGTCSHGVCRYDTGITNARFVVTTYLTNGKRVVKSFKLKV